MVGGGAQKRRRRAAPVPTAAANGMEDPAAQGAARDGLEMLPDALMSLILMSLDGPDLVALALACTRLRDLVYGAAEAWKRAYVRRFPLHEAQASLARLIEDGGGWREAYGRKAVVERHFLEGVYEARGFRGSIGSAITAIAIDDAERYAAVGSENGGLKLFALRAGEEGGGRPGDLVQVLRGHRHKRCSELLFLDRPRCTRLLSCGWDGDIKARLPVLSRRRPAAMGGRGQVWGVPGGEELAVCSVGRAVLAARAGGGCVEAVTNDAALVRLEYAEEGPPRRPRLTRASSTPVGGLAGAPLTAAALGRRLVAVSSGGSGRVSVYARDEGRGEAAGGGRPALELRRLGEAEHYGGRRHWRHPDSERLALPGAAHVRSLAIAGDLVASGGDDGTCKLFDASGAGAPAILHTLVHGDPVSSLHADAGKVLVASMRDTVGVWRAATGELAATLGPAPHPLAIAGLGASLRGVRGGQGADRRRFALRRL
eukprot:tig00001073_g6810.t1